MSIKKIDSDKNESSKRIIEAILKKHGKKAMRSVSIERCAKDGSAFSLRRVETANGEVQFQVVKQDPITNPNSKKSQGLGQTDKFPELTATPERLLTLISERELAELMRMGRPYLPRLLDKKGLKSEGQESRLMEIFEISHLDLMPIEAGRLIIYGKQGSTNALEDDFELVVRWNDAPDTESFYPLSKENVADSIESGENLIEMALRTNPGALGSIISKDPALKAMHESEMLLQEIAAQSTSQQGRIRSRRV